MYNLQRGLNNISYALIGEGNKKNVAWIKYLQFFIQFIGGQRLGVYPNFLPQNLNTHCVFHKKFMANIF